MNMPDWRSMTLDWLQERVRQQHHKALQQYLCRRSAGAAVRDDARFNLDVNRVLRDAFVARNGATTVPTCAIRVLRKVPGTDPEIVWQICLDAIELCRGIRIPFDTKLLRGALGAAAKRDPRHAAACERIAGEVTVREIMAR